MSKKPQQIELWAGTLPPRLTTDLQQQNPWWVGRSLPRIPEFKRWPYVPLLTRITRDPPLARINVLRGLGRSARRHSNTRSLNISWRMVLLPTAFFECNLMNYPACVPYRRANQS